MARQFEHVRKDPFGEDRQEQKGGRRMFNARVLELASTIPLGIVLIWNFNNKRTYYDLDTSNTKVSGDLDVVKQFYSLQVPFQQSLESLSSVYRSAYHKSRQVPYTTTDSDGNVQTRSRTEYYWAEESGVPIFLFRGP